MTKNHEIIPCSRPWLLPDDALALTKCIEERSIGFFRRCEELVTILEQKTGLCCRLYGSGKLALVKALEDLGLLPGAGVAVSAYSCPDIATAVKAAGLTPVPVDCLADGRTDAETVGELAHEGKVGAAIAIHTFGCLDKCMESLASDLPVIEDASHVPPGRYFRHSVAAFGSIEATKLVGAGEGGYLLTPNPPSEGEPISRMSDLTATIAIAQLARMDENLHRRSEIAGTFLAKVPRERILANDDRLAWFRFIFMADDYASSEETIKAANARGIILRRPVSPLAFEDEGGKFFPKTLSMWQKALSVPILPDLDKSEIARINSFLDSIWSSS